MKIIIKLFAFLSLLFTGITLAYANSFCSGYYAGYKAGYCYRETYCVSPIPPLCPLPNLGENSYSDGYDRGFLDGLGSK